jgi:methylglyoxal/glyoxal reductase
MNGLANFKLSNGVELPPFVLGTNYMEYPVLKQAVKASLKAGCFAFDTAPNYVSEKILGRILRELQDELGISRETYFVQTKLDWNSEISGKVLDSFDHSLKILELEYIDSYLIHWPYPDFYVKDWLILEQLYDSGRVRSIGVCNFHRRHWDILLNSDIRILPHINQIELHPLRICKDLVEYCGSLGIITQAYSPTCSMIKPIIEDEILNQLASKYNVSLVSLILRWHYQRGIIPVSRSTNPDRILANFNIGGFLISDSDVDLINGLDMDYKFIVESFGCPGF